MFPEEHGKFPQNTSKEPGSKEIIFLSLNMKKIIKILV